MKKREWKGFLLLCVVSEGLNLWCNCHSPFFWKIAGAMFGGCLLAASVMDLAEHMVYRYVWFCFGSIVICCVILNELMLWNILQAGAGRVLQWKEWLIFVILQQVVFANMYGRADCHAFCCCGAVWMLEGKGFDHCVQHLAVSFGLLVITQVIRGNINRHGRLKQPVPMLPYITVGFWFCRLVMER